MFTLTILHLSKPPASSHLEFIEIVYSSSTFRLYRSPAIRFITTVPAPYLALTTVHLTFSIDSPLYLPLNAWPHGFTTDDTDIKADEARWEAFWRKFSRVRVRNLIVEITDGGVRVPEQLLLRPLNQVKAGSFEVVLPWPDGLETSGEFRGAIFTVRRPPEGIDLMMGVDVVKCGYPGVLTGRPFWRRIKMR